MPEPLEHRTPKVIDRGTHFPLGATLSGDGVNFAVYSRHSGAAYLLLFDSPAGQPTDVIELRHRNKHIWHVFVHGLRPGQLYGYKMCGDYAPERGLRFNDAKLLLDPYAKAVTGKFRNVDNLLLGYDPDSGKGDLAPDARDNCSIVPKAIVVDDTFDWQGTTSPNVDLQELIIYELHVKGFTAHPSSSVEFPGTYLGFIEKIPHLSGLGVNAVELLPVHEKYVEDFLCDQGLTNYWGYNSIGFFAPESSYATARAPGCQVTEFKTLIRELHRAGIKVILDVVYNHSGEGNEMGPTLSFRGLDNPSYYNLTGPAEAPRRFYKDFTGCGNSLRFDSRAVIRLVMDSLRYWVEEMRVDGFRFDLAPVLGRDEKGFDVSGALFQTLAQDPVLNQHGTLLIAEPWDIGTHQLGKFPVDWSEWNGRFRDTIRRFGKGDGAQVADLGWRITGSADLYGDDGRSAYNSINFVTCHDGFTLHDLVSYDEKHNEANGESNEDGCNDNNSWNCGVEGDSDDPAVLALRRQLMKNYLCWVLFALGTPMILGGDEFARTQRGNNNAYCQDNEISWYDWTLVERNRDLVDFVRKAIGFTRRFPVFQQRKSYLGEDLDDRLADLTWFAPDLSTPDWDDKNLRTMCYQLDAVDCQSDVGLTRLYLILNGHFESEWISLPSARSGTTWFRVIDTSLPAGEDFAVDGAEVPLDPADHYITNARSTVVLLAK